MTLLHSSPLHSAWIIDGYWKLPGQLDEGFDVNKLDLGYLYEKLIPSFATAKHCVVLVICKGLSEECLIGPKSERPYSLREDGRRFLLFIYLSVYIFLGL